jgi:hypothetical protein
MRTSCEWVSEGSRDYKNILRIYDIGDAYIYIEVEAQHDGHKVCSTVKIDRGRFKHDLIASGVLS